MSAVESEEPEREPFLLNALNGEYLTGKRKRPTTRLIWRQAETLLVAVATFFAVIPLLSFVLNDVRISLVGIPAIATVSNHLTAKTDSGRGRSTVYTLVFIFTQGSASIRVKQDVPQNILDAHPIGSAVTIRYLPNEPETARLSGPDSFNDPFLGVYILLVLILFLWSVAGMRRWIRLDREERRLMPLSRVIGGEVESASIVIYKGRGSITVGCRFTSPETGRVLHYTGGFSRAGSTTDHLPPAGTPMRVLYYSDRYFWVL